MASEEQQLNALRRMRVGQLFVLVHDNGSYNDSAVWKRGPGCHYLFFDGKEVEIDSYQYPNKYGELFADTYRIVPLPLEQCPAVEMAAHMCPEQVLDVVTRILCLTTHS